MCQFKTLLLLLSLFRALSSVLRASLSSVGYTCCIQSTSNDMVTYTWKVLNTTASYHYD